MKAQTRETVYAKGERVGYWSAPHYRCLTGTVFATDAEGVVVRYDGSDNLCAVRWNDGDSNLRPL